MADVLNFVDISDALIATLRHLDRLSFTQIAQPIQNYEIMGNWLRKNKVMIDDGAGISRQLMTKTGAVARHVGLFEEDDVNFTDHLVDLTVNWRHLETAWPFDVKEKLMNRGKSLIQRIVEPRRVGALIDMAEELETQAWKVPATGDDKFPFGIPYYVCVDTANPGGTGFNGALPGSHTAVAGVDPTTHTNYKNYQDQYTNITETDALSKMRKAAILMKWKSPVSSSQFRGEMGRNMRIYTGIDEVLALADLATARNDRMGFILGTEDNQTTFLRHPIVFVPQIDETDFGGPTAAIYMINHSDFNPVVLKGDFLRETVRPSGLAHDVVHVFTNLTYNFICLNRRTQAVLTTDAVS
jgi:hypothetical protein